MTAQECIDALNSINWDLSPGEIYNEFRKIACMYSYNYLYPILCNLRTYEGARAYISGKLLLGGIYAVKECLEHIEPNYNTDLFRISEDGHLEQATIPYLRGVWIELTDSLQSAIEVDRLINATGIDPEPDESKVVWVEEDDDFLTARKV
ncbi:MAG: hypothetical protein IJF84_00380 [Thermoguttaceae bacterium]|nr:hypothetical protein [Thermoguttaceae bacterium]